MNRLISIAAVVAIVGVRLAFLGSASASATSITLPDGWVYERTPSGFEMYATALPVNDFDVVDENVSIVTEPLPRRLSLSEYVEACERSIRSVAPEYKVVTRGKTTLCGEEAVFIELTHWMEGLHIHQRVSMMVKGRAAYLLTCTASTDTMPEYRDVFIAMERSMRFD